MVAAFAEDRRRARIRQDAQSFEFLAVSRQHYYGIAILWNALGELDRAKIWAKKLSEKFSPKGPPVVPTGFGLNPSISFALATVFAGSEPNRWGLRKTQDVAQKGGGTDC